MGRTASGAAPGGIGGTGGAGPPRPAGWAGDGSGWNAGAGGGGGGAVGTGGGGGGVEAGGSGCGGGAIGTGDGGGVGAGDGGGGGAAAGSGVAGGEGFGFAASRASWSMENIWWHAAHLAFFNATPAGRSRDSLQCGHLIVISHSPSCLSAMRPPFPRTAIPTRNSIGNRSRDLKLCNRFWIIEALPDRAPGNPWVEALLEVVVPLGTTSQLVDRVLYALLNVGGVSRTAVAQDGIRDSSHALVLVKRTGQVPDAKGR